MISVPAAAQIAKLRARRLSMLSRIGLGELIWPWMWPVQMTTVGSRAQRIERIPGASLSVSAGAGGEEPAPAVRRIGIGVFGAQVAATLSALLAATLTAGAVQIAAVTVAILLYGPVLVESVALLVNCMIRPGQLLLGRRRRQLATDDQVVLILTSYIRDPAAPKGTAKTLLIRLQRKWQAENVIVLGYPANRPLQLLYADLGAIGDGWRGRRMKFDYSSPGDGCGKPCQLPGGSTARPADRS